MKVEKDSIASIKANLILIMYIETFKTGITVFISNFIICLTSH